MAKRQTRKRTLHPRFLDGFTVGWHFQVPDAFRAAFDIKLTPIYENRKIKAYIWTQGEDFAFKAGDVFYDSKEAYELSWGEAIKKMVYSIQVLEAEAALGEYPGQVRFKVFEYLQGNHVDTYELVRTQDEFLYVLEFGLHIFSEETA